ncbi:MAG: hypothetical protein K8F30_15420, partial [Taibaiella sp.]|nr:hypothetical protein [Taibaiella sp.]
MMQLKRTPVCTLVLIVMLVALTSGVYRNDTPVEQYLELASRKEYDCVGCIYKKVEDRWTADGSCVLIDSMHILTAAHC